MYTPTLPIEDLASAEPSKCSVAANLDSVRRIGTRLVALAAFLGLWELASTNKIHFVVNFAHVPPPSVVAASAADFAQAPNRLLKNPVVSCSDWSSEEIKKSKDESPGSDGKATEPQDSPLNVSD